MCVGGSSGWAAMIVDHCKMEQGLERDDGEGRHRSAIRWGTCNQPLHLLSSHRSQRPTPIPGSPHHHHHHHHPHCQILLSLGPVLVSSLTLSVFSTSPPLVHLQFLFSLIIVPLFSFLLFFIMFCTVNSNYFLSVFLYS